MELFNKSFFRFAIGFLGIILFSVALIVGVNSYEQNNPGGFACLIGCEK